MPSVSATPVLAGVAAIVVIAIAWFLFGVSHTTTQQTSERLGLEAKRDLASQKPIPTAPADHSVKVIRSQIVRSGKDAALVAVLRNATSAPVNDLPLAAGVETGGKPDYVNVRSSDYFQGHAPAIAPGEEATWVLSGAQLPAGAPAVTAAKPKYALPAKATSLPQLQVTDARVVGGSAVARLSNPTDIPQYKLEVYAWAQKGGRFVAAGRSDLGFLNSGETVPVQVPLVGDPKDAQIRVEAPPSIFQ